MLKRLYHNYNISESEVLFEKERLSFSARTTYDISYQKIITPGDSLPIRKPDSVQERRMTLGQFERKLEQDKLMIEGFKVVGNIAGSALAGLGGLGIGGGILLAALIWGKPFDDLKKQILELWPEGGAFLSPEWIAKWGGNPDVIIEDIAVEPENPIVKTIPPSPLTDKTLEGLSAQDAYNLGSSGRQVWFQHAQNNIINNWLLKHPKYHPIVGDYSTGLSKNQKATIIAKWHEENPQPPPHLLLNETNVQTMIRVTWAKKVTLLGRFAKTPYEIDSRYIEDPMLDFLAFASYVPWQGQAGKSFIWNEDFKVKVQRGKALISIYAYWTP